MNSFKKSEIKILIAGNECRHELAGILKRLGYSRLKETGDGVSAWNILKRHGAELVFADWQLGQFDALVLLKIMMADENLSKIPLVLLCESINREMVIDAGHAGVSAVMVKPFSDEKAEEKIKLMFEVVHDMEKDMEAEKIMEAGRAYFENGQYEEALQEFGRVLELYENPEVYYNIGYIKASQKKYDESIQAFRRAITIDKKFAQAYRALGEVYLKIGQKQKAEELMQRAGEIYMEQDMTQEAEVAFNEVLKLNPNTINIYNSLGILYRRRKDFKKAMGAYERALRVDPEDENIFFNLGRACYDAGMLKRARLYLNRAVELYPDFQEARLLSEQIKRKLEENDGSD